MEQQPGLDPASPLPFAVRPEHLSALLDSSPLPAWVHQEGRIVYINPAGVAVLGAERPEQILGRSLLDFIDPLRQASVQERLRCLQQGEVQLLSVEEQMRRLDGTGLPVEVTAWSIPYGTGHPSKIHRPHRPSARRAGAF